MLERLYTTYREQGFGGLTLAARKLMSPPRAKALPVALELVRGQRGLEIGGPSGVFARRGVLPLYESVGALDNCNFASVTRWEGAIREGRTFHYSTARQAGHQFVAESTDLRALASGGYDFLISSHVLEHSANAIRALEEWKRVVRPGGAMILLVPHRDGTFDHRRPVTSLRHLLEDFENGVGEDDLTHVAEILELHDLSRDPGAGSFESFSARCVQNAVNRCIHHHVFDARLVAALLDHVGLRILDLETIRPNHIVAVARTPAAAERHDNGAFLAGLDRTLRQSPFPTDRLPRTP